MNNYREAHKSGIQSGVIRQIIILQRIDKRYIFYVHITGNKKKKILICHNMQQHYFSEKIQKAV